LSRLTLRYFGSPNYTVAAKDTEILNLSKRLGEVVGVLENKKSAINRLEERHSMFCEDFLSVCDVKDKRSRDLAFALGVKNVQIQILEHKNVSYEKKMEEKENIMRSAKENFDKMFASYFQT